MSWSALTPGKGWSRPARWAARLSASSGVRGVTVRRRGGVRKKVAWTLPARSSRPKTGASAPYASAPRVRSASVTVSGRVCRAGRDCRKSPARARKSSRSSVRCQPSGLMSHGPACRRCAPVVFRWERREHVHHQGSFAAYTSLYFFNALPAHHTSLLAVMGWGDAWSEAVAAGVGRSRRPSAAGLVAQAVGVSSTGAAVEDRAGVRGGPAERAGRGRSGRLARDGTQVAVSRFAVNRLESLADRPCSGPPRRDHLRAGRSPGRQEARPGATDG